MAREHRRPEAIVYRRWSPRTGLVAVEALPVAWIALCMGMGFGPIMAFISVFARARGVENPGFYFTVQSPSPCWPRGPSPAASPTGAARDFVIVPRRLPHGARPGLAAMGGRFSPFS